MCLQERQVLSDHKSISYEQGQACKSMENWAKDEGEDVDVSILFSLKAFHGSVFDE
jgi:hypothetical protein